MNYQPEPPVSEEEIRSRLARIAFQMRHTRDRLKYHNEQWAELVGERIELEDRLKVWEIDRAEHP